MYCLSSIGRTASPVRCESGHLIINGNKVRCPSWQRQGTSLYTSQILVSKVYIPVKHISNYLDKITKDFLCIGMYSFKCFDWPEVADEKQYYVVFNKIGEFYDVDDVIACYGQHLNPLEELKPHL